MADPRFFKVAGPFTVAEIAVRTGASVVGAHVSDRALYDVAPLQTAADDQLTFFDNRKYLDAFRQSRAGAVLVHPSLAGEAPANLCLLVTEKPYRAYAVAAQAFYPEPPPTAWRSPVAVVDASAKIGEGCRIEPYAVIGAHAEIGRRCVIGAGSVIGAASILGDDVRVGAQVTISHAIVGARVRLYPGARIGQDGFGFSADADGFVKVPQLGRVIIGDDVEIGANVTIDRGSGPDTVIGAGAMIDNLVQIGHNVQVGRNCVLVAQSGISGSTRLGDFVMIGGQAGLVGHLEIGSGARIGAQAGVPNDVAAGETVLGSPAVPIRQHHRQVAALKRLAAKKVQ
ncbi:MAG TPA: UDP-3-O-(3-hydroxymyristoyl)glucosamine N-acyltransferase [Stellaceae bacterium]|jgi:UDP-3-O-[3-hydroxymyristoyl] glucosamine N-acyltransferase|nr:UDP-3-O-(3-hydroxymyristoyl)glucosamine N-acyltransferase [Stellaceae bacterium]